MSWEVRDEDILLLRKMYELNESNYRWGVIDTAEYEYVRSKIIAKIELIEAIKGY